MTVHYLKCDEPWFTDLFEMRKTFEVRRNDRGFQVGDVLQISSNERPLQFCVRNVKYVLQGGQHGIAKGYVVLGLA